MLVCKTCIIWVDDISPPILSTGFQNYIYLVIQKHSENALAASRWQKTHEVRGYKVCAFIFLRVLAAFQEEYCNMAV